MPTGRKAGYRRVCARSQSCSGESAADVEDSGGGEWPLIGADLIDRTEVVRRGVADDGGELIARVAPVVATDVAAALLVPLHRVSFSVAGEASRQRPDQTGGRFWVKAAIPSA